MGATSTLTFTINNAQPGYEALTNVVFSDTLPSGLRVANPPTASAAGAGCTGVTFNPMAGATTLFYTATNVTADLQAQPNAGDTTALIGGSFTETNPNTNNFYVAIDGGNYGSATAGRITPDHRKKRPNSHTYAMAPVTASARTRPM